MLERRYYDLWGQLQGKKPHMPHFLDEVRIQGIRGIDDLRVVFDYPVTVIAGGNASGKTTVLFAAACAYKVPGARVKDYVPSTLFPDYRPREGGREDERPVVAIEFHYTASNSRQSMVWRRNKGWNRSFMGRKGASQPERQLYLRTLSNLSNPSEVRGVLSMSRLKSPPQENRLTASQIEFAQRMLPFRYSEVVDLTSGSKNLLFATQDGGAAYSELHMASGERAILRLSQEIAQLRGALVLIDEVEAGLHPWVQQLLMLHLQELALRNDLQIIVTSHSPVMLDSVPAHGRVFLDRDRHGKVSALPAYRDVVQDALYGRSRETLNILCEDDAAEGVLRGVFDFLVPRQKIALGSIRIGRDTGADEFPAHARAFEKFNQAQNFVFVLDGDRRESAAPDRIRDAAREIPILFLPGKHSPEIWIWGRLRENMAEFSEELGLGVANLAASLDRLDSVFGSADDSPSEIAKSKLARLGEEVGWNPPDICRIVARRESNDDASDIQPLVEDLQVALDKWRSR